MITRKRTYYHGIPMAPYDVVKEVLIALGVVTLLVVLFAAIFSSPDVPSLTLKSIALSSPQVFTQTALDSLDGNSAVAGYGPPYNNGTGSVQYIGPLSLQKLIGVHIPVNTAQDYVLGPLEQMAPTSPRISSALATFNRAPANQQTKWENAYNTALSKARENPPNLTIPSCSCGPVTAMMSTLLSLGQSGAMDGLLLTSNHFYQTDFTRPLLFLQNDAVAAEGDKWHLLGSQWGVMNETGNYPGQAWLWLYTLFYQVPPYTTAWAANTDALALVSVTILSLILLFLPWMPGLNRLPRFLGIYRLIWKDYYRRQTPQPAPEVKESPA